MSRSAPKCVSWFPRYMVGACWRVSTWGAKSIASAPLFFSRSQARNSAPSRLWIPEPVIWAAASWADPATQPKPGRKGDPDLKKDLAASGAFRGAGGLGCATEDSNSNSESNEEPWPFSVSGHPCASPFACAVSISPFDTFLI